MKVTKNQLKQLIEEVLNEARWEPAPGGYTTRSMADPADSALRGAKIRKAAGPGVVEKLAMDLNDLIRRLAAEIGDKAYDPGAKGAYALDGGDLEAMLKQLRTGLGGLKALKDIIRG